VILKRIGIFFLSLLFVNGLASQANIAPSNTNACTCSGAITYNTSIAANATFVLIDQDGSQITSGSSPTGIISISGLCPEAYTLELTQLGNNSVFAFNVPTQTTNAGDAATVDVCSTDPNVNFETYIPNLIPGGIWSSPLGQNVVNPVPASQIENGWYTYTLASGGCSIITGVLVNYIQNADAGLSTTYLICEDYVPFNMVDFLAGAPDLGGTWYNEQNVPMNGVFDPATMNSGLFFYVINNIPGCGQVASTLFVDENTNPNAGENASILVCQNGAPFNMINFLNGTPEGGGTWYNPSNVPVSGIFNPSTYAEGNYRYHQNGLTPCVDDNAFLNITFIQDDPSGEPVSLTLCENGNSVNMFNALNGNPLPGGNWTNSTGQIVDGSYNPQTESPGTYHYYYPNVGCSQQGAGFTVTLENTPNAGLDNTLSVCENVSSINLNGLLSGTSDLGGNWTNTSGTTVPVNFIPPANGTTFIFQYHANGNVCPDDVSSITIHLESMPPSPPAAELALCADDPPVDLHTLFPDFPLIEFENPNGTAANSLFNPSTSNDINLTTVQPSSNSCPNSEATLIIDIIPPLFPVSYLNTQLCSTQGVVNLESLDPNANALNGTWMDANGNSVSPNIPLNFTGVQHYTFLANNGDGCGGSEFNVDIESFQSVEAGPNNQVTFCNTDSPVALVELLPSTSGGGGAWTINGDPFLSANIDPAVATTGSYLYTIPANGPCPVDVAELYVIIQQGLEFNAGEDTDVCAGGDNIQLGETPNAGMDYLWSPAVFLNNPLSSFPIVSVPSEVNSDQIITYHVEVNDGVCATEDDVTITIHPLPAISIGDQYEICNGEVIQLSAVGNGSFEWSPAFLFDGSNLPTQSISPTNDVNLSVTITDENGCQSSDNASVIVHPNPTILFEPLAFASCSPLNVEYAIDAGSLFVSDILWNIPGIGIFHEDTLRTELTESGQYDLQLIVHSDFGCSDSLMFNDIMEVYESPVANFKSSPSELTTLDPVAQFVNQSVGAVSYFWQFDELGNSEEENPSFEFPNSEPANFTIQLNVMNEMGCKDSTTKILHLDNQYIFYAPNAITPDNDGINDYFQPVMRGFEESTYSLEIFNRWGDLIFQTKEYGQPWTCNVHDGGYYSQDGVYIWQVQVKDKEMAEYRVFRGFVTIIR
jgi:gliding motility-associated-like protein